MFKKLIQKALDIPKNIFKSFPFSISISIIISLVFAVFMESSFMKDLIIFLLIFPIGVLFSEIYFAKNKNYRIWGIIISLIMAIVFNQYILEGNELIARFTIIYVITLIILGLIKLLKDSKLSLEEYLTRLCSNLFKTHLIFSVLSFGLLLISLIIMALFLNNSESLLIIRLEVLLLGIYYVPAMIYSFTNTKDKPWDFIVFLLKNITSVILIIAFGIIYLYMLKVLITWNIPSNYIFRIVALLFILGLPLWTMINSFDQESVLVKICNNLPLAFIPLIALQIYSLVIRISNNGFTIMRYVGIMLIIVEVLYSYIYTKKKEKVYLIGYALIIMSIIGIIIPRINAIDVTVNNQYKIITRYLEKKNLSPIEHSKLYSSYRYLMGFDQGRSKLNDLTKSQIEFINESKEVEYNCYYSDSDSAYNMDIEGYKRLSTFEVSSYNEDITFDDLNSVIIKGYEVNLSSYVKRFIRSEQEYDFLKDSNILVEDNFKLYVNDIQVCLEDYNLKSYTISGYILEK